MYDRGVRGAGRGRQGGWTAAGRLLVAAALVCGSLRAASSDLKATVNAHMARLGFSRTHIAGNVTAMHYRMAGIEPAIATLEARIRSGNLMTAGFADRSPRGTVTTAREAGRLLERLYKGEIVSRVRSGLGGTHE